MKPTDEYIKSVNRLIESFIEKYYTYDDGSASEWYIIGGGGRQAPDVIEVSDMYWDISRIYEALLNDIPEDKLMDWYWYQLNKHQLKETPINLVSFALGAIEYTEEQKLEDNKKIMESFNSLRESIDGVNNKQQGE